MASISVVLAVRDEAAMLPACLSRLSFADEIVVVVDERTVDDSAALARAAGALVIEHAFEGFSALKNVGISVANSDWVFILDADERVTRALAAEILQNLDGPFDAFRVQMANYFHGRMMTGGGWQERPLRLWRRGLATYSGTIHERPDFGSRQLRVKRLSAPLVHFSHRTVLDNLRKSVNYVDLQAHDLLESGARPVRPWRLYWSVIREVAFRLVWRSGWRDGVPGVAESLYWPFSHMAAQVRLWELQQSPSIEEQYRELESATW